MNSSDFYILRELLQHALPFRKSSAEGKLSTVQILTLRSSCRFINITTSEHLASSLSFYRLFQPETIFSPRVESFGKNRLTTKTYQVWLGLWHQMRSSVQICTARGVVAGRHTQNRLCHVYKRSGFLRSDLERAIGTRGKLVIFSRTSEARILRRRGIRIQWIIKTKMQVRGWTEAESEISIWKMLSNWMITY